MVNVFMYRQLAVIDSKTRYKYIFLVIIFISIVVSSMLLHSSLNDSKSLRTTHIFYWFRSKGISLSSEVPKWEKEAPQWQTVRSSDNKTVTYLLSAYSRNGYIIILAFTSNYGGQHPKRYCQIRTSSFLVMHKVYTSSALLELNAMYGGYGHADVFYSCKIPQDVIPEVVSLVEDEFESPSNFLNVISTGQNTLDTTSSDFDFETFDERDRPSSVGINSGSNVNSSKPIANFVNCVAPLYGPFNNIYQLVEIIEINRIFGSDRIVFYNFSIGPDVDEYLRSYIEDGIVEVVQWHLPPMSAHYYGQQLANNDCLYRSMSSARYIVYTDMDEYVVPRRHKSWVELFKEIFRERKKNSTISNSEYIGHFTVHNVMFRTDWGNDLIAGNDSIIQQLRLSSLLVTNREKYIHPLNSQPKVIVNAKLTVKMQVHHATDYPTVGDKKVVHYIIPPSDALLHHFRRKYSGHPEMSIKVQDRRMHDFQHELVSRALLRHEIVRNQRAIRKLKQQR